MTQTALPPTPKRDRGDWARNLPPFLRRMLCPDVSSAEELEQIDLQARRLEVRVRLVREQVIILQKALEAREGTRHGVDVNGLVK